MISRKIVWIFSGNRAFVGRGFIDKEKKLFPFLSSPLFRCLVQHIVVMNELITLNKEDSISYETHIILLSY